ncbi:MAG: endonuclease/exonuclease/phosphatase family protein [Bacteroidota bacterium]
MVSRLLDYRFTQMALNVLIVLGAVICVFTPNYYLFKIGAGFAVKIMIGYLLLSMFFLVIGQSRLMFTSMICCAGLCLFLKYASNTDLKFPNQTSSQVIKFSHLNISNSGEDYPTTIETILSADADIISIQEVTPDWARALQEPLKALYPHSKTLTRLDPYGVAVFSKHPFRSIDTFHFEEIPNIVGSIRPPGFDKDIHFISAHTVPPLYSTAFERMKAHLDKIIYHVQMTNGPMITMGDFNAPPWWAEIQNLKDAAYLQDSRRSSQSSFDNLFQNPIDYILYSDHFECIGFENIQTEITSHLGITGTYQFNTNASTNHAESAIQDF